MEVDISAATLKGSTYTVVDDGLDYNGMYFYSVAAKGATTEFDSFSSPEKKVQTGARTPDYVSYSNVTDKTVTLSWEAVTEATSYKVEKFYNGKWSSAGTAKTATLTVKSLKPGQTYTFRIVAVSKTGKSVPVETMPVVTLASTPKTPTLKTVDSNSVNVT